MDIVWLHWFGCSAWLVICHMRQEKRGRGGEDTQWGPPVIVRVECALCVCVCQCECWLTTVSFLSFAVLVSACVCASVCACLCMCVYFIQFSFQLVCNCSFVRWLAFLNSCDGISPPFPPSPPLSLCHLLLLFHLMCNQILGILRNRTRHSALCINSIRIPCKFDVRSACSACLQGMLASYCALYITLHPFIRVSSFPASFCVHHFRYFTRIIILIEYLR